MKPHDGADLIQGNIAIGATAGISWLSTMGTLLEVIPSLLGIVVIFLSAVLLLTQIKNRRLKNRILENDLEKQEREEEERKVEVRCLEGQGFKCKRHTDKKYTTQTEGSE